MVLKLKFFKFLCALYTSGPSQHSQPEPLQPDLSAVFRSLPAGASLAAVLAVPSVSKAVFWLGPLLAVLMGLSLSAMLLASAQQHFPHYQVKSVIQDPGTMHGFLVGQDGSSQRL